MKSELNKSKIFESLNGLYDIVVCHNTWDAQKFIDKTGYEFPSWCYATSQHSFDKYTSHTEPLGARGGVMIMFFRKDSNSIVKTKGFTSSKPLLCDDYAVSVFSLTTDLRKENGRVFVRSVTNRYNKTHDIYSSSKPADIESEWVRRGLECFSRLTGMDVEAFSIDKTPDVLDNRRDADTMDFKEVFNNGEVILRYPDTKIAKNKKSVLCSVLDSDEDEVLYDIQPSGIVYPHGAVRTKDANLLKSLPPEAIDVLRGLYKGYVCKLEL